MAKRAIDYRTQVDYYAFSDQDDIWSQNKLFLSCVELESKDESKPNLFTSNSILIDSSGNEIGVFHQQEPIYSKGNVLIFGTEQGCSMVYNKKALELFVQKLPQISYHDRYMYMICCFLGTVSYSHTPLFYYRLHNNNAIGSRMQDVIEENRFIKIYKLLFFLFSKDKSSNHKIMACEFYENYGYLLSQENKKIVRNYLDYNKGLFNRFRLLKKEYRVPDYVYVDFKTKIIYYLWVIFLKL